MAKVYSWQVSERAFAYIVDPNDTSIPRIGSEITNEKDIQTISDWAQNATDTQYEMQKRAGSTDLSLKGTYLFWLW